MLSTLTSCLLVLPRFVGATGIDPRPAIGLDLGQSYGTAAVHFPNGTIVKLARVDATPEYQAFIRQQVYNPSKASPPQLSITPPSLQQLMPYPRVRRARGLELLTEMLTSLRNASENILKSRLPDSVVMTMPYMTSWDFEEVDGYSLIDKARRNAGIGLIGRETMTPDYLSEANTVLAAHGHRHCRDLACHGPEHTREPISWYSRILFVSPTDASLYVTLQTGVCFFQSPSSTARISRMSPEFGLSQQNERDTFWQELEEYLIAEVEAYAAFDKAYKSYWVVLSGEGAQSSELTQTAKKVITHMQTDTKFRDEDLPDGPKIGLIVSKEPVYAAAIGAAFRGRTMIDSEYCQEYFDSQGGMWMSNSELTEEEEAKYDVLLEADRHDEL